LDYTDDKLNYILGAYYLPALQASSLAGILDGLNGISALTGGFIAPLAPGSGDGFSFTHLAQQEHSGYAILVNSIINLLMN
jgi:hypothetical protein